MPKRSPPLGMTTRRMTSKKSKSTTSIMKNDRLGAGGFGEVSGKNYEDIMQEIQKNRGVSHRQILVKKTYHHPTDLQQAILMDERVHKIDPERIYLRSPIDFQHDKGTESQYLYMRNQGYSLNEANPDSEIVFRGLMASFYQLLIGLVLLQNHKMVHGDIKDSNITVDDRSPEEAPYKPFTLGLIDFDLLADTTIKKEFDALKHPKQPYFLRPLELYYEPSIKKFVVYPIQKDINEYQRLLYYAQSIMSIYRRSIIPMVKYIFPSLTDNEKQWIRHTILGIMARINFPDHAELDHLLTGLVQYIHNAETNYTKDQIADIKFISYYWKMLDKIDRAKITSIPYLDAFWKMYRGSYKKLKKDWTKIDTFGLGLVAQKLLSSSHSSSVIGLSPFLLSMVHPDPSKRLNAKQALHEWLNIMRVYDLSQYKRILREIEANKNLEVELPDLPPTTKRVKF